MLRNGAGGAAVEDLTARARIRDEALRQFTEVGFDRATIRDIARAAGVSPGLVRHHFGSKEELRNACDSYALQELHGYVQEVVAGTRAGASAPAGRAWDPLHPLNRYLARALIDDSPAAAHIFDQMVEMTEQVVREADNLLPDSPAAGVRDRAAVMVAMTLGIPAFQAQVSRSIGTGIFTPEGARRTTLALLDIHSRPVISPGVAAGMREGLGKPAG